MNRRRFLQAIVAAPAIALLPELAAAPAVPTTCAVVGDLFTSANGLFMFTRTIGWKVWHEATALNKGWIVRLSEVKAEEFYA